MGIDYHINTIYYRKYINLKESHMPTEVNQIHTAQGDTPDIGRDDARTKRARENSTAKISKNQRSSTQSAHTDSRVFLAELTPNCWRRYGEYFYDFFKRRLPPKEDKPPERMIAQSPDPQPGII